MIIRQLGLAIGVLTSNRKGLATNFGGVHVGRHCWVPLLESRHAGVLLGAIAGSHCSMPFLGAIAGCHCEKAIAGCHCEKKLARVIHHSPLHLSLYIDNTQIGLCYLGSMLAKFSGRQPRSYTASVRRRTSTARECRERPWKPIQKTPASRHRRKKNMWKLQGCLLSLPHCFQEHHEEKSQEEEEDDKNGEKNNTCKDTQCIWTGGAAPSPPTPLQPFFCLRLPPLTATLLPRTSGRKKHKKKTKMTEKKQHMQRHPMHLGGRLRLPPLTATLLPRTSRRKNTRRRRQK